MKRTYIFSPKAKKRGEGVQPLVFKAVDKESSKSVHFWQTRIKRNPVFRARTSYMYPTAGWLIYGPMGSYDMFLCVNSVCFMIVHCSDQTIGLGPTLFRKIIFAEAVFDFQKFPSHHLSPSSFVAWRTVVHPECGFDVFVLARRRRKLSPQSDDWKCLKRTKPWWVCVYTSGCHGLVHRTYFL